MIEDSHAFNLAVITTNRTFRGLVKSHRVSRTMEILITKKNESSTSQKQRYASVNICMSARLLQVVVHGKYLSCQQQAQISTSRQRDSSFILS